MKLINKLTAAFAAVAMLTASVPAGAAVSEDKTMNLTIDGASASLAENTLYRGIGMVSANNSSRLLLDYKAQHPERYEEIMQYLFGEDGINISHLKIEMGADINSSSGTEPCVMRSEDEPADVTRGAGYQLAADAKKINPDLTLDMLWWSEPRWVTDAEDDNAARYKWYRETLIAAYETYGLVFDYVSANRNEKTIDEEWIKYLSKALKSDTDTPYDFSEIKIVAADEVTSWAIARKMLNDPELLGAVDVVGSHYTSWSTDKVRELMESHGKEIWFSEASSPMSYSQGTYRYDGNGSGLGDLNGMLDIANRIITMYPGGGMTLHELQPAVAAYYDGATYYQKQLILANEPWNGYYLLDSGFFMGLHFSQFFKKGWAFVDSACAGDGKAGGDGHAIVDAVYSYMTATDTATGDYSTVITNTTAEPITYNIEVANLDKASAAVNVWETRGPDSGAYDENYYKHIDTVTPADNGGSYSYSVTVKPYSMVTLSTLDVERKEYTSPEVGNRLLELPYSDDYEYADKPEDFLASRGGAPLYTTDQGGAFEVVTLDDGNNVLMQKITEQTKANEWGSTPKPTTTFGDDRWYNYSVSADVYLAECDTPDDNYVGVGMRYNLGTNGIGGWWLQLYGDGVWRLKKNKKSIIDGTTDATGWVNLKIEANDNIITAYINGEQVAQLDADEQGLTLQSAGRAALFSGLFPNYIDNVKVEAIDGADCYIDRFDGTDENFTYSGEWTHSTMDSFKNYKRTIATGSEGAVAEIKFSGTGLAVTGLNAAGGTVKVEVDGEVYADAYTVPETANRETFWRVTGLTDGEHTVKLTVTSGSLVIDAAEVTYDYAKRLAAIEAEQQSDAEQAPSSEESAAPEGGEADTSAEEDIATGDTAPTPTKVGADTGLIVGIAVAAVAVAAAVAGTVIFIKRKKK